MKPLSQHSSSGFTLVELLVTVAVVASLAAASLAGLASVRARAIDVTDLERMRGLGVAIYSWASDHQGKPPRSSHSANGHGELGWQREILPHLGYEDTSKETLKKAKPQQFGIDPKENPSRTPALNVYFELNPEYDDYEGAPKSWRDFMSVPQPSRTDPANHGIRVSGSRHGPVFQRHRLRFPCASRRQEKRLRPLGRWPRHARSQWLGVRLFPWN